MASDIKLKAVSATIVFLKVMKLFPSPIKETDIFFCTLLFKRKSKLFFCADPAALKNTN